VAQTLLAAPTSNTAAVAALVPGIIQGQQKTEFYDAVVAGVAALDATSADRRVLVILSDGEDTLTQTFTQDNDPIVALSDFKNTGGIVMAFGLRAAGLGYGLMSAMSTGGFFINALPTAAPTALALLSGLKGYVCAGNCTPAGDKIVYKGQLDYNAFINWDVVGGTVDLIGNDFFDFLPGNGLYVDLGGTTPPQEGTLTLKAAKALTIVSGRTYRLTLVMAGNNRIDEGAISALVRVYDPNIVGDLINQTVIIPDFTQPFQSYSFSFTAQHDASALISIVQNPTGGDPKIGLLLGEVIFEDRTNLVTLLDDNFDTENPTYQPPACGLGTFYTSLGYISGYAGCYGEGCLDTPPPAQVPDPQPLPDIESGYTPPKEYTSTKQACASCKAGTTNVGASLVPIQTTDGAATASSEATGASGTDYAFQAFDGNTATKWSSQDSVPQWLQIDLLSGQTATMYSLRCAPTSFPTSWNLQGSNNGSTWTTIDDRPNGATLVAGAENRFSITTPGSYRYYRLNVLTVSNPVNDGGIVYRVAIFEMALYGAGVAQICSTKSATSLISQQDADNQASTAALTDAQAQLNCQQIYSSTQQYTAKCPVGTLGNNVTRSASATSLISQADADATALAAATAAAEAALTCTSSNNDQNIVINDRTGINPAPATPYPSVKTVTGLTGHITKVTVSVNKFTHGDGSDVAMMLMLRNLDGTETTCLLMLSCGGHNGATNLNFVFDDTGPAMPSPLASGTFQPTQVTPQFDLPGPAPVHPYGTTLSVFNGKDPNGSWSLWICDDLNGESGTISGSPPWDLTITSA
jgi:hypothetical protein